MESHNTNLDIDLLVRAKTYLDAMPSSLQSEEYRNIVALVNAYIEKNCSHNIVSDSIDVCYEQSKTIYYCELCLKTFHGYKS